VRAAFRRGACLRLSRIALFTSPPVRSLRHRLPYPSLAGGGAKVLKQTRAGRDDACCAAPLAVSTILCCLYQCVLAATCGLLPLAYAGSRGRAAAAATAYRGRAASGVTRLPGASRRTISSALHRWLLISMPSLLRLLRQKSWPAWAKNGLKKARMLLGLWSI